MKVQRRTLIMAALMASLIGPVQAAEWVPERPIRIVVPYPPGGAADVAARSVADRLAQELGQSVVVENRAGAGGVVGTDYVFRASPDGYTLLVGASDAVTIAPHLQPELIKYAADEFVAVSPLNLVTTVLVTRSESGIKTLKELLERAKNEELSYASWGNGSLGHVSAEAFRAAAKINLLNVPFQGAAPAAQSVLANQVDLIFMPGPLWLSFRDRVNTLGVASDTPFQNLPSLTSQGVPVDVVIWQGILAPPKTPTPVVERLNAAFTKVLSQPDMQQRFVSMGSIPLTMSQPEFTKMVSNDFAQWKKTLEELNIRPQ